MTNRPRYVLRNPALPIFLALTVGLGGLHHIPRKDLPSKGSQYRVANKGQFERQEMGVS